MIDIPDLFGHVERAWRGNDRIIIIINVHRIYIFPTNFKEGFFMKAIHADPKEIRRVFNDRYIIPNFQRPYSWEKEHCDKLWDDLLGFYQDQEDGEGEKYFLGNIVIHPQDKFYAVIDGQQRLTTIVLLLKALHQRAGTVKALEACLKIKDPLTDELTDKLRVESHVFEEDKDNLYDIIFHDGNNSGENKIKTNFLHLSEKLTVWIESVQNRTDKLNNLILMILDKVVLLPIHCASQDDALVIFETINNRGMPLNDADIFKAKLHKSAGDESTDFIKQWNSLNDHEWLFRIHMNVLRAKDNDTSKEIALRTYFTKKDHLNSDWKIVMNSLKKYHDAHSDWNCPASISAWWAILETFPNYYWNFPIYVFIHKYGSYTESGALTLSKNNEEDLIILIRNLCRFFFIKGLVYNTVSVVRDPVFRLCTKIESGGNYLNELQMSTESDIDDLKRRIESDSYGRYLRGLVLIATLLNKQQSDENFCEALYSNYHIEHILPKKWNNYDGWTEETHFNDLNKLGNLVPLEWKLNISAKNEFFSKKREKYNLSKIQEANSLISIEDWTSQELDKRDKEIKRALLSFFEENII